MHPLEKCKQWEPATTYDVNVDNLVRDSVCNFRRVRLLALGFTVIIFFELALMSAFAFKGSMHMRHMTHTRNCSAQP